VTCLSEVSKKGVISLLHQNLELMKAIKIFILYERNIKCMKHSIQMIL